MFTLTLDSILEKLHIAEDANGNKTKNIFDELATKIESNLEKLYDTSTTINQPTTIKKFLME